MQAEQWCLWPKFPSFLLILTENWWSNIYNLASVLPRMNWRPRASVTISDALGLLSGTWDQVRTFDSLLFYWVWQIYIWLGASKNNEVTKFEDDSDDDDWSEKPAKKDDKIKKPPEKEESRKKESTFLGGVFGKNKETVPPKLPTRKIVGERFEKIAKTETFYIAMTTL